MEAISQDEHRLRMHVPEEGTAPPQLNLTAVQRCALVESGLMAVIRAYRGLRYRASSGALDTLIAPPYDVLSSEERADYASRNPFNVVHITLPEAKQDDRSKYIKYARSAATLSEWRREGVLELEKFPAIYRYVQEFSLQNGGPTLRRTAIIALLKLEPFSNGVVLPHEQTFPKHKEDRLRILEATRAHLENIFGLFEDPGGQIHRAISEAPVGETVSANAGDGITQEIAPITDETAIAILSKLLADKKIWIADGHHRYETALAFREALGLKNSEIAEDFIPIALTSMSDPGLVLLPTHRVLPQLPLSSEQILEKLKPYFQIKTVASDSLVSELADHGGEGKVAFGLVVKGGESVLLTPIDLIALSALDDGEGSPALKALDVTILHRVIFEKILGYHGVDSVVYTRDPGEAIALATNGASSSWLMNPPTVDDMKTIALGGERMPQKSTYYFPKIQSGLVLWTLDSF